MLSLVVTDITYLSDTFIAHFLGPQQTTPLGLHYPQHKCFSDHHLLEPLFNLTPELQHRTLTHTLVEYNPRSPLLEHKTNCVMLSTLTQLSHPTHNSLFSIL
jgi:hypothetical protein